MANLPTLDDLQRALLDEIARYCRGPDEIFPIMGVLSPLWRRYSHDDLLRGVEDMTQRGLIASTDQPQFQRITALGFEAI